MRNSKPASENLISTWNHIILSKKPPIDVDILLLLNGKLKNKKLVNKVEIDEYELDEILNTLKTASHPFYNISRLLYIFKKINNPLKSTLDKIADAILKNIINKETITENLIFAGLNDLIKSSINDDIDKLTTSKAFFIISYLWYKNLADDQTIFIYLDELRKAIYTKNINPTNYIEAMLSAPNYDSGLYDFIIYYNLHKNTIDSMINDIKIINDKKFESEMLVEQLNTEKESTLSELEEVKLKHLNSIETNKILNEKIIKMNEIINKMSMNNIHKIKSVRGKIKGVLSERIMYLLINAKDALNDEIPLYEVVKSRLDETIKQIEREMEWLDNSE